jgi:CelD/BcsL family acetyltransferase involved in cellulose biosynthesis
MSAESCSPAVMTGTRSIVLPDDHLAALPAISTPDFRIDVVENTADFAAMREEWNELLSASRSNCVFLTWEWLHTWWIHLGRGRSLFIVTVRSGSQLVAVAPLTMTRGWVGPFTVPMLEFAGIGTIGSDYLDFIVRSSCQAAAIEALTVFLAQTGHSVRLPSVKEDSIAATTLRHGLADLGWHWREVPMQVCPFIDLSGRSWESYLSSLGSSHRYNFRRRLRNLEKDHTVRFEQVSSEEDRREALKHVVRLHLMRWQSRGGSDAFNHPKILAFHEEVSRLALERGWLRLFVLRIDGHAAAAFYAFRYGQTFHFYQSGFDPAFERYSVGLVTLGLTIRGAIEEGAAEYDMLHGDEAYKFLWTTQVRRLLRLELYVPGRMGRMHRNSVHFVSATRKIAKRVLKAAPKSAEVATLNRNA